MEKGEFITVYPRHKETIGNNLVPYIIVNRSATGAEDKADKLFTWFRDQDITANIKCPKTPEDSSRTIEELAKISNNLIIVLGGDGTHSQAVRGYLTGKQEQPPVLILYPAGNANDAANILYPNGIREIPKALLSDIKEREIDTIKITVTTPDNTENTYYSIDNLGFGVMGEAAKILEENKPLNKAKELKVVKALSAPPIRIKTDEEERRVSSLSFHNLKRAGKYFKIRNSKEDDGLFEVLEIKDKFVLSQALKIASKGVNGKQYSHFEAELIDSAPFQIDGEPMGTLEKGTKIKVDIVKGAILTLKTR